MKHAGRLIVFLVPPEKIVNGGILSIFSICATSRKFADIHKAKVIMATYPGTKSYRKNDLFENDETILSFDEVVAMGQPSLLQLHVPEYASHNTIQALKPYRDYLQKIPDLRVNILNQNILLMQPPSEVAAWFTITTQVTQSTAHNKYATQAMSDDYSLPLKHFSTFVDERQYIHTPFKDKEKIIALSPDVVPNKEKIIEELSNELPEYTFVTIEKLTYEEYKKFIAKVRFTITFGEGFDGYFVESFFSQGICFAVYNESFFPNKRFDELDNTFSSIADLTKKLPDVVRSLERKQSYDKLNKANLALINDLYGFERYENNLKQFYAKKFDFTPEADSAKRLIGKVISDRDEQEIELRESLSERNKTIDSLGHQLGLKDDEIRKRDLKVEELEHSLSWRITAPLRKLSRLLGR